MGTTLEENRHSCVGDSALITGLMLSLWPTRRARLMHEYGQRWGRAACMRPWVEGIGALCTSCCIMMLKWMPRIRKWSHRCWRVASQLMPLGGGLRLHQHQVGRLSWLSGRVTVRLLRHCDSPSPMLAKPGWASSPFLCMRGVPCFVSSLSAKGSSAHGNRSLIPLTLLWRWRGCGLCLLSYRK